MFAYLTTQTLRLKPKSDDIIRFFGWVSLFYIYKTSLFSPNQMVYCIKQTDSQPEDFLFTQKGFTFRLTFFFCFIEPLPLNYHIKYNIRPYPEVTWKIYRSPKPKSLDSVLEHILLRDFHYVCYRVRDEMNKNERRVWKNIPKVKRYFPQFFGFGLLFLFFFF